MCEGAKGDERIRGAEGCGRSAQGRREKWKKTKQRRGAGGSQKRRSSAGGVWQRCAELLTLDVPWSPWLLTFDVCDLRPSRPPRSRHGGWRAGAVPLDSTHLWRASGIPRVSGGRIDGPRVDRRTLIAVLLPRSLSRGQGSSQLLQIRASRDHAPGISHALSCREKVCGFADASPSSLAERPVTWEAFHRGCRRVNKQGRPLLRGRANDRAACVRPSGCGISSSGPSDGRQSSRRASTQNVPSKWRSILPTRTSELRSAAALGSSWVTKRVSRPWVSGSSLGGRGPEHSSSSVVSIQASGPSYVRLGHILGAAVGASPGTTADCRHAFVASDEYAHCDCGCLWPSVGGCGQRLWLLVVDIH